MLLRPRARVGCRRRKTSSRPSRRRASTSSTNATESSQKKTGPTYDPYFTFDYHLIGEVESMEAATALRGLYDQYARSQVSLPTWAMRRRTSTPSARLRERAATLAARSVRTETRTTSHSLVSGVECLLLLRGISAKSVEPTGSTASSRPRRRLPLVLPLVHRGEGW